MCTSSPSNPSALYILSRVRDTRVTRYHFAQRGTNANYILITYARAGFYILNVIYNCYILSFIYIYMSFIYFFFRNVYVTKNSNVHSRSIIYFFPLLILYPDLLFYFLFVYWKEKKQNLILFLYTYPFDIYIKRKYNSNQSVIIILFIFEYNFSI